MNRSIARDAVDIRNEVRKTEAAMDEALLQSTRLMQRMIQGRQNPGIRVDIGQDAIARLLNAQLQIVDGASEIFRVHSELSRVARDIGMSKDDDDTVPPDPTGYMSAQKAHVAA
jgi:hypothetical protein